MYGYYNDIRLNDDYEMSESFAEDIRKKFTYSGYTPSKEAKNEIKCDECNKILVQELKNGEINKVNTSCGFNDPKPYAWINCPYCNHIQRYNLNDINYYDNE